MRWICWLVVCHPLVSALFPTFHPLLLSKKDFFYRLHRKKDCSHTHTINKLLKQMHKDKIIRKLRQGNHNRKREIAYACFFRHPPLYNHTQQTHTPPTLKYIHSHTHTHTHTHTHKISSLLNTHTHTHMHICTHTHTHTHTKTHTHTLSLSLSLTHSLHKLCNQRQTLPTFGQFIKAFITHSGRLVFQIAQRCLVL